MPCSYEEKKVDSGELVEFLIGRIRTLLFRLARLAGDVST